MKRNSDSSRRGRNDRYRWHRVCSSGAQMLPLPALVPLFCAGCRDFNHLRACTSRRSRTAWIFSSASAGAGWANDWPAVAVTWALLALFFCAHRSPSSDLAPAAVRVLVVGIPAIPTSGKSPAWASNRSSSSRLVSPRWPCSRLMRPLHLARLKKACTWPPSSPPPPQRVRAHPTNSSPDIFPGEHPRNPARTAGVACKWVISASFRQGLALVFRKRSGVRCGPLPKAFRKRCSNSRPVLMSAPLGVFCSMALHRSPHGCGRPSSAFHAPRQ